MDRASTQDGETPYSEEGLRRSLAQNPSDPDANYNLGVLLARARRLEQALAHFRTALAANPAFELYWLAYCQCLVDIGRPLEAIHAIYEAASRDIRNARLSEIGERATLRLSEAEARRLIVDFPDRGEGWKALGLMLHAWDRRPEAMLVLQKANALMPGDAEILNGLGNDRVAYEQWNEAETFYRSALAVRPAFGPALANMGLTLVQRHRSREAVTWLKQAIAQAPELPHPYSQMGTAMLRQGRPEEAADWCRRALEKDPGLSAALSNLVFCLAHCERLEPEELFREHRKAGRQIEANAGAGAKAHANDRDPDRVLTVGFVSGELRLHPMTPFVEPLLDQLAAAGGVRLAAFSSGAHDDITDRLRGYFSSWEQVGGMSDAALSERIRDSRVDVLVDLSGHTGRNRLPVFAMKPAPIQVSWIGYLGTSGMQCMDYYLADRLFLPRDRFQPLFTEKLVHLPAVAAFLPDSGAPPVGPLPAAANGYLTLGSFNRISKLSDSSYAAWSSLLRELPDARLVIANVEPDDDLGEVKARFAERGVDPKRLTFLWRCSMAEYHQLHARIDFCLDAFAYAGGTTTSHALWMGVPTLTVMGATPVRRFGASIQSHLGLDMFVSKDAEDFVRKGVEAARDIGRLAALRAGMRQRLKESPVGQPAAVAAGFLRAVRLMWQRWCADLPPEPISVD